MKPNPIKRIKTQRHIAWPRSFGAAAALALLAGVAATLSGAPAMLIEVADADAALIAVTPAVDLTILDRPPRVRLPLIDDPRGISAPNEFQPERHPLLEAIERESTPNGYLEKELLRQLKRALPGGGEGMVFGNPKLPSDLGLEPGPWEVKFEFRTPRKGIGRAVYSASVIQNERQVRRITGSINLDRMARGVQVRRVVRRGEKLRPGDLVALDARLSLLPKDSFASVEGLVGTAARSEIRPGTWITGRMLKMPTMVKNRQAVTVRLVNGAIRLTTKGTAKQDGVMGEVIRVENGESKREVLARVISHDLVEVVY